VAGARPQQVPGSAPENRTVYSGGDPTEETPPTPCAASQTTASRFAGSVLKARSTPHVILSGLTPSKKRLDGGPQAITDDSIIRLREARQATDRHRAALDKKTAHPPSIPCRRKKDSLNEPAASMKPCVLKICLIPQLGHRSGALITALMVASLA